MRSVLVRQPKEAETEKMAPRFPRRPTPVLPAGSSRLQRSEEGARCYKKKCTKKKMRVQYECVEAVRRQLRCCRRKIGAEPTEQYATTISQELRTVFK